MQTQAHKHPFKQAAQLPAQHNLSLNTRRFRPFFCAAAISCERKNLAVFVWLSRRTVNTLMYQPTACTPRGGRWKQCSVLRYVQCVHARVIQINLFTYSASWPVGMYFVDRGGEKFKVHHTGCRAKAMFITPESEVFYLSQMDFCFCSHSSSRVRVGEAENEGKKKNS